MNDKKIVGKLDASSKKDLDLMDKALKEKYDNMKKIKKNNTKIA